MLSVPMKTIEWRWNEMVGNGDPDWRSTAKNPSAVLSLAPTMPPPLLLLAHRFVGQSRSPTNTRNGQTRAKNHRLSK